MRPTIFLIMSLGLAACTSRAIPMVDPASGQHADCGSHIELWLANVSWLPGQEMACQRDYEARGWVRAPLQF
jgi:hypothetical protein